MGERLAIEVVQRRSVDLMQQRSADLMQQEVSKPHAARGQQTSYNIGQ